MSPVRSGSLCALFLLLQTGCGTTAEDFIGRWLYEQHESTSTCLEGYVVTDVPQDEFEFEPGSHAPLDMHPGGDTDCVYEFEVTDRVASVRDGQVCETRNDAEGYTRTTQPESWEFSLDAWNELREDSVINVTTQHDDGSTEECTIQTTGSLTLDKPTSLESLFEL